MFWHFLVTHSREEHSRVNTKYTACCRLLLTFPVPRRPGHQRREKCRYQRIRRSQVEAADVLDSQLYK